MAKHVWLTIVGLTVAAAVGYYQFGDVAAETPVLMSSEVTRGAVVTTIEATGTLEAVTTVQVGSQVSGTIKTLHADFNSEVRQGQVIAELDPSLFETQVEQAQATLVRLEAEAERARIQAADAQITLRRTRDLFGKDLVPANDLESAESNASLVAASVKAADAQVAQAQASLNQVQVNLSHTIIRAPIDGVVIARNVDVGQTVAASMSAPTLFVLARDLAEMRVSANVDESDIGEIQAGQAVQFRVDAYPDTMFTGAVSQVRLQPEVQQNVVSYVTIIDVPNPDLKLKPGMTAAVTIEIARLDDVARVPNAALRFRPSEEMFTGLGLAPPVSRRAPETSDGLETSVRAEAPGAGGTASAQREAMRQRMQTLTPEAREQMRAGVDSGSERERSIRGERTSDRAMVWVLEQEALTRVPVRTGISDGTQTAILEVLEGELAPGTRVVTGALAGAATASATTTSPLLPVGRRGGGPR